MVINSLSISSTIARCRHPVLAKHNETAKPLLVQSFVMSRSGGMADAKDSKSFARKGVWVQVPPPALDLTSKKQPFYIRPSQIQPSTKTSSNGPPNVHAIYLWIKNDCITIFFLNHTRHSLRNDSVPLEKGLTYGRTI